ncbi:tRNA (adenosine(37)-N6)-threonylcarbamoyltransferase complex ATPase subunit type 1 TsaE [Candidatus Curtissbacteria bacterium RIFCSPLOWO2_02_41_11]|uniref:tRNA threonylcarbamoyladenosine biosynthesis protein TsaE n=2 Tax=Candidatus Curtissiibacteriota TaxID=1752717 RepID=A0A1F5HSA0_9BACT|nr:MAG: hypothetical protein UU56_C0027G0009 [Candidatus Curtissbacteria bacterium GW2011_GWA2_41_24]OGE07068.1 MAG: tRNA (adenosine(37)-N6)-threonylcarbamoyltransferase complex ATPase subunit type 1 TsaE [Candidatus Curtissbacteria bacterium RIFCSPLOWO2_02_41_11]
MEVKTNTPFATQKIAQDLAKNLKGGEVIALFGDLGAGKTVFVQGLARGLGIKRRIISPSFVFMRTYPIILSHQTLTFYHLDLYKGESMADLASLGLDEIFSPESVVVLEWADRIKKELPKKRINVFFETIDEKTRRISIKRS